MIPCQNMSQTHLPTHPLQTKNNSRLSISPASALVSSNFGKALGAKEPELLSDSEFLSEFNKLLARFAPGKQIPASTTQPNIDDTSLLMTFDIRLQAADGQEIRIAGQSVLNHILAPSALPEAPDMLQNAHYTHIWRPLRVKTLDFLQNRRNSPRRLPMSEGSLSDHDANFAPPIPAARQYEGANPASLSAEPVDS